MSSIELNTPMVETPMIEKPSTPIDDEPEGPTSSNNLDDSEPQQGEGATDQEPKYPRLSDPYENEPKLEGDPFGHLFKVLSDKDTAQCKAWEDEVLNILIFAALFSAVVTAFIIESYQRLQPDPNDVMVSLLAHIAQRLDGVPLNETSPVLSILSGNSFSPTHADIRINAAWFISLVLSLTAALIGIVTLQWLREHRRYPSWTPKDKLGILNMRMESLERWYVPHIFASLPLFVQGSLIFFFAGIIEFLFGLDTKVAIPVTLCICIPLAFLLVTTMFPLLQIYFLLSPLGLPVRTGVPSPCPYKSPQSTIFRRIGSILLLFIEESGPWSYVATYLPLATFENILPSDWAAMDKQWLQARAEYASLPILPPHASVNVVKNRLQTLDHDAFLVFRRVMDLDTVETDMTALYHCMNAVYSKLVDNLLNVAQQTRNIPINVDRLVSSILSLIRPSDYFDLFQEVNPFIQHIFTNSNARSDGKGLLSATLLSYSLLLHALTPRLSSFVHELIARMALENLTVSPVALFKEEDINTWRQIPKELLMSDFKSRVRVIKPIICRHVTYLFHDFLKKCTQPHPVTTLRPDADSYGATKCFIHSVVSNQYAKDVYLTLVHLKRLCNNAIPRERPFLFVAACFYVDRVSFHVTGSKLEPIIKPAFQGILGLLCLQCNVMEIEVERRVGWKGLGEAVKGIYNAYTNPPEGQESSQNGPDISEAQPDADPDIEFNPDASSEV